MPAGPHIKKADNGVYYAHWVDGSRSRRQSLGCKDLGLAKARFAQWLAHKGAEDGAQSGPTRITIGALWAHYREGHVLPNLPKRNSITESWRLLEPFFGEITLTDLTQADINRFVAHRRKPRRALVGHGMRDLPGAKDSTIRQNLIALSACLNWCADRRRRPRIIEPADVPAFDMPPPGQPRDRWLSMAEVQKLLDAARDLKNAPGSVNPTAYRRDPTRLSRVERFLWLGLETAARQQAICELTWDRVDFETGMIDYNVPGRQRTTKRRAAVPISSSLRPVLERAYAERTGPLVLDNENAAWALVKEVAEHAGVPDVSPHVLRHTAATHMARRGVPLWLIANVLGNTLGMVERVYAKHCPQAMSSAVEMISAGAIVTDLSPKNVS